jgi:putative Mg2+ transporter-C (MgtC) family protein
MKEGVNIRGLNTAATLWCSAAVGAAAGAALLIEAATLTGLVIAGNTLLRPLVNAINRIPLDEAASEANYQVRLTATPEHAAEAREALVEALEGANYPVADIDTTERGDDLVDIVATLVATSVVADELDAIATRLERTPGVEHATWESVAAG